jgi:hypothetical protein
LTCSVCLLLIGANVLRGETARPQDARAHAATGLASPEKIVQYVRDRFKFPESVNVTAEAVRLIERAGRWRDMKYSKGRK